MNSESKVNPQTGVILIMGREMGRGAYGKVYLSTYHINKYPREIFYACKKIDINGCDLRKREKLHNEIDIHLSLQHNHIVKLYEYFEDSTNMYIILDHCIGDLTKVYGNFHERKKYMYETLLGLQYLHNKNIIHRDIKPHNILIKDNAAKIADFGHAVRYTGELFYDYAHTANYVAPEIIQNIGHSFPVDIWSYGATLYWVLTHSAPFEGTDHDSTYDNIIYIRYDTTILLTDERELLKKIFVLNPAKRIDITGIYASRFFAIFH